MNNSNLEEPPLERSSSFIRIFGFIIACTVFLAFVLGQADRETVINNWAKRRCDLGVLLTSAFYKPDDYAGNSNDFATENFNFCVRKYAAMALGQAMQPAVQVAGGNIQSSSIIGKLLDSLRLMMGNLVGSFGNIINNFYGTYRKGVLATSLIAQRLNAAVKRIEAIVTAFMYMTLSTYIGLMNMVKFVLFVCIVIILIIVVIFILLFFVLWPVSPTLVAVCVTLAVAGLGAAIGGAASVFCFADDTMISLADGSEVPIHLLRPGQRLADGGIVEGMFTFNGEETPLYDLYGTFVSGTHLVMYKGRYMEVASHPDAKLTEKRVERVYCPITSTRKIPVVCADGKITLFCDWEEVDDIVAETAWDTVVEKLLGVTKPQEAQLAAGLGPMTMVDIVLINGELKPTYISNVTIGQTVMDGDGRPAKVLGVVRRSMKINRMGKITDGVWFRDNTGKWSQRLNGASTAGNSDTIMYHLITDSGTIRIYYDGEALAIRDATEVGIERLRSCTPTVLRVLNNEMASAL